MIIFSVKFKSKLSSDDIVRVMEERADRFRAIPGLIQKFYGFEKDSDEVTGIYLWDSEQSLREFRETELAKTIPEAYQMDGQARFEVFEVPYVLRS